MSDTRAALRTLLYSSGELRARCRGTVELFRWCWIDVIIGIDPAGKGIVMPEETRKTRGLVITALMAAVAVVLGWTHWGFIPWFGGVSLTIMHVPVVIAAVVVGPWSGAAVGLVFGIFSMIQAAVAPAGPTDVWFTNPLLSVLPRLFIGPAAWLVWRSLKRWPTLALAAAGAAGSLANTVLVLGMIGMLGYLPWVVLGGVAVANGLPELVVSALLTTIVVAAYWQIPLWGKKGADLKD